MTVSSYLELYTTLLGWAQFENVWILLAGTGIVFVPFLFVVIEGYVRSVSAEAAIADAEVKIGLALTVVVLAAQPTLVLDPAVLKFRPPCDETEYTVGNTDSSYDTAFVLPGEEIEVPIWWYGVLALSSGITRAAIAGLDCRIDFRKTLVEIDTNRIADPFLVQETAEFIKDCFIPARSTFYRTHEVTPEMTALLERYGPGDTEWFGSHLYRETPGFYDRRRASLPIINWSHDPARDTEPDMAPNIPGRPYCKQWYEHPEIGLRRKLLDQADIGLLQNLALNIESLKTHFHDDDFDMEQAEDGVIAGLVSKSIQVSPNGEVFATYTDAKGTSVPAMPGPLAGLSGINVTREFAEMGTFWENLSFSPMMYAIRAGAPIVQALILLAIYIALPVAIVFSRYSWTMIFTATLAIFALFFWGYLWHVAVWLENQLVAQLYGTQEAVMNAAGAGSHDPNLKIKARLLNMATSLMFIGFPLLFSMVVGWAGYVIGGAIANVFGQSSNQFGKGGKAAADQAKSTAANVATTQVNRRMGGQ